MANTDHSVENALSFLRTFPTTLQRKVVRRVSRRVLSAVRMEAGRIAKETYTARPKKPFAQSKIDATSSGYMLSLRSRLGYSLAHFKARPSRVGRRPAAGTSAQVKRSGARRVYTKSGYDKPFLLQKKQGGVGIFVRKHGVRAYGGKNYQMLYGAAPIQALMPRPAIDRLKEKAYDTMNRRIIHEVNAVIQGYTR